MTTKKLPAAGIERASNGSWVARLLLTLDATTAPDWSRM